MDKDILFIVEGIAGIYYYHLSLTGKSGQPTLCGNTDVMNTLLPINTWGMKTHINERYCPECDKKLRELK